MQDTIRRVIRIVSATIVPVGLLLYRSQRAAASAAAAAADLSDGWVYGESVVRTVSGVIGMIPEGLVLLTSVSFIIGVGRLARKKALVQEMEAIEALARADILCLDKTGTITTGDLKVRKLITVGDVSAAWVRSVMAHMGVYIVREGEKVHPRPTAGGAGDDLHVIFADADGRQDLLGRQNLLHRVAGETHPDRVADAVHQ